MAEISMRFQIQVETGEFIRVFESHIPQKRSLQAAYEATEQEHERRTGQRKYSNYKSFTVVRGRKKNKR